MKYFMLILSSLLFVLVSGLACADIWEDLSTEDFQLNEDVEEYVWKEGDSRTPDYPQESDLVEVSGPPAYRNYQYLVDTKNIQLGEDRVVRYTVVIRSPGGSDNVLFDGIRCTTQQIKNYAYGSIDSNGKKKFVGRTNARWKGAQSSGVMGYSKIFIKNYFCDFDSSNLKRNEIIQKVKYGGERSDGLF